MTIVADESHQLLTSCSCALFSKRSWFAASRCQQLKQTGSNIAKTFVGCTEISLIRPSRALTLRIIPIVPWSARKKQGRRHYTPASSLAPLPGRTILPATLRSAIASLSTNHSGIVGAHVVANHSISIAFLKNALLTL